MERCLHLTFKQDRVINSIMLKGQKYKTQIVEF